MNLKVEKSGSAKATEYIAITVNCIPGCVCSSRQNPTAMKNNSMMEAPCPKRAGDVGHAMSLKAVARKFGHLLKWDQK